MNPKHYVDGVLVEWGERWDWGGSSKGKRSKGSGLKIKPLGGSAAASAKDAAAARRNLRGFARKTPQVMVKISGGAKGLGKAMAHLRYISRNGELPLEDEQGERTAGREGLDELRKAWGRGGHPIPEESEVREAIHIVLSMPAGTDELAVLRAARDFARREFADNHQYAMALHTYDTDPGPKPSKHPHVHLAVKSKGFNGRRLNPRKGDLQAWREGFALALREQGIEAVATRRRTRLQQDKGESLAIRKMKARGVSMRKPVAPAVHADPAKERARQAKRDRAIKNAKAAIHDFKVIADALSKSDGEDRRLAVDLVGRLRELNAQQARQKARQAQEAGQGRDR